MSFRDSALLYLFTRQTKMAFAKQSYGFFNAFKLDIKQFVCICSDIQFLLKKLFLIEVLCLPSKPLATHG